MNFKLDYGKAQTLQVTNDAFFFLLEEEEPLDEENLDEAREILAMFPHGFHIEENWKAVENSDLIEVTFVPYVEDDMDFDEYEDLTKYIRQQIKWIGQNRIRVWWYNNRTGTRELRGDFDVQVNNYGLRYFQTGDITKGKGSMYFLKHYSKRNK